MILGCATPAVAQTAKRVALVVGNADYRDVAPFRNADRDASDVGAALERLGFEVARAVNADLSTLRASIAAFQRNASGADAAVIFYSGYAARYRGAAVALPIDASLKDEASLEWDTLQFSQMLGALSRARASFLIVDGCGNDQLAPLLQKLGGGAQPGAGDITARTDMLVALSTPKEGEACERASRGDPFVGSLLSELERPALDARLLFRRLQQLVQHRSGGKQNVALAMGLAPGFMFANPDSPQFAYQRLGADPAPAELRGYADRYGDHPLGAVVKTMLIQKEQMARQPNPSRPAADPWRGQLGEQWVRDRQEKARAARDGALDARWSREEADRQAEIAAAERARQEEERVRREREEKERIARELETARRIQAEIAAAEARRLEQERAERAERERLESEQRARVAREQEEERKRQADLAAAEQRRVEAERVAKEKADREERERLARAQEEERKRQVEIAAAEQRRQAELAAEQRRQQELAAAEQRRLEAERVAREKAEREERERLARIQEEERKRLAEAATAEQRRQAEAAAAEARRVEAERVAKEKAEREERERVARAQEEERKRQAEAAAAETRRVEAERVAKEKADRDERARVAREQEAERKRVADAAAAEQKRVEAERIARERAERDERARLAREQEAERKRVADAAAAEQKRVEAERVAREKAERDERERLARVQQDEERQRQSEQQRLALALATPQPAQPQATLQPSQPATPLVGGQAQDEVSRFTAEQRRLAQERLERERRARPNENPEFVQPLPSETGQASTSPPGPTPALPDAETRLAAVAPPAADRPAADPNFKADSPETIRTAQQELKRLGCYSGNVHGRMNNSTKTALGAAAQKLQTASLQPMTEDGLRALRDQQGVLCPPAQAARRPAEEEEDDEPVRRPAARPRPAPAPRPAPQAQARPAPAPAPRPAAPAPAPAAPRRNFQLSM